MDRCLCLTVVLALLGVFQTAQAQDLETLLTFEGGEDGGAPSGWGGSANGTVFFDGVVVHSGDGAVRLERGADSPDDFSTLTHGLPVDFAGRTVELRGFLRTENVRCFVGLWLRQDGEGGSLAFDNMQDRGVRGTTPGPNTRSRCPSTGRPATSTSGC